MNTRAATSVRERLSDRTSDIAQRMGSLASLADDEPGLRSALEHAIEMAHGPDDLERQLSQLARDIEDGKI